MGTACEPSRGSGSSARVNVTLLAVLLGLVAVLAWKQLSPLSRLYDPDATPREITPRGNLADDEKSTTDLFKKAVPSVVHITTTSVRQNVYTRDVFEIPAGAGSGIIWDLDGHIVTNLHVIQDAQSALVTLNDSSSYNARLVGFDTDHDVAVLKINAPKEKLVPIDVGTSKDLQVGQKAFAIGSPFEFDKSLTTGIVSGLDRTIKTERSLIHGAIQTDAAVNPGNSGGPLLDSAGRLIGVNTAIFTQSGGSHGIGFAVPVDVVNLVVPDLIRDGSIDRPWLGVIVVENMGGGNQQLQGVAVRFVAPDGPADRAGLQVMEPDPSNPQGFKGDLIVRIDGEKVQSRRDLLKILSQKRPGDTVKVSVIRNGTLHEVPVLLDARPQE